MGESFRKDSIAVIKLKDMTEACVSRIAKKGGIDMAEEKEYCPVCNKRVFDFIERNGKIVIKIKCPRCGKVVVIEKNISQQG